MSFCLMPWNLNPCFPLVIPSGPRDSHRDLAQPPGSGSYTAWMDVLQLQDHKDWGWLSAATWQDLAGFAAFWTSLNSSLGCFKPPLSPHSALPGLHKMQLSLLPASVPTRRWEKNHIWYNNNHNVGIFWKQSICKIRHFLGKPQDSLKFGNIYTVCFVFCPDTELRVEVEVSWASVT